MSYQLIFTIHLFIPVYVSPSLYLKEEPRIDTPTYPRQKRTHSSLLLMLTLKRTRLLLLTLTIEKDQLQSWYQLDITHHQVIKYILSDNSLPNLSLSLSLVVSKEIRGSHSSMDTHQLQATDSPLLTLRSVSSDMSEYSIDSRISTHIYPEDALYPRTGLLGLADCMSSKSSRDKRNK